MSAATLAHVSARGLAIMCIAQAVRSAREGSYATAFALLEQAHDLAKQAHVEDAERAAKNAA